MENDPPHTDGDEEEGEGGRTEVSLRNIVKWQQQKKLSDSPICPKSPLNMYCCALPIAYRTDQSNGFVSFHLPRHFQLFWPSTICHKKDHARGNSGNIDGPEDSQKRTTRYFANFALFLFDLTRFFFCLLFQIAHQKYIS